MPDPINKSAVRLIDGRVELELSVSVPIAPSDSPPRKQATPPTPDAAPDPASSSSHSRDFASVNWRGTVYTFTPTQRLVVAALWQAREDGHPFMSQEALLDAAESDGRKLRDVFRNHPAWNVMIVQGLAAGGPLGTYRLAPEPSA